MRSARRIAARRGWALFTSSSPRPSRDEINAALDKVDLPHISIRMYDHYGRLARHGVADYMPINELDIAVKNGQLRKAS